MLLSQGRGEGVVGKYMYPQTILDAVYHHDCPHSFCLKFLQEGEALSCACYFPHHSEMSLFVVKVERVYRSSGFPCMSEVFKDGTQDTKLGARGFPLATACKWAPWCWQVRQGSHDLAVAKSSLLSTILR